MKVFKIQNNMLHNYIERKKLLHEKLLSINNLCHIFTVFTSQLNKKYY